MRGFIQLDIRMNRETLAPSNAALVERVVEIRERHERPASKRQSICGMVTPHNQGPIHAGKRQCEYWYSVAVRHLVNRTDAIKMNLHTRKIQMQVTAVVRPCNQKQLNSDI